MKLFSEIPIAPQASENQIDYRSKVLLLGSCFVENIGEKFKFYKFQNLQNPFGVLFQPKAIETLISQALNHKVYTENDLFQHHDIWHSYTAHSKLSGLDKTEVLNNLNAALSGTESYLKSATHIVITLGTAWVYRHKTSETIVANCHKVPQKTFSKELLSVADVVGSLQGILKHIAAVNPQAKILFTVSPIRHIKDGFVENTRSKSHLLTAIHQLIDSSESDRLFYFPSYEIVMDELRDYRFYTSDLIHPNQTAIDYIWEKFRLSWLSPTTVPTMKTVKRIQNGLQHKPFNPESESHQKFVKDLNTKIQELQEKNEGLSFDM